ncbi:MAG: S9 family peptidase, partial [Brachybacterium tyrofermentans]
MTDAASPNPSAAPQGTSAAQLPAPDGSSDPHEWLEDVTGEKALAWVREHNAAAESELDAVRDPRGSDADEAPLAQTLQREILEILDATDRIPGVVLRGEHLYNFWTDGEHERGLWRRTTLESYRTDAPDWEILLDVDALNEAEGEDWVWHGASLLRPVGLEDGEPYRHALIDLSHGGSDADVTREFDLETRAFVPEAEGGFFRPEAKGSLSWIDVDTVWASTDFGEGTMTSSGYARQARLWTRGTPLDEALLVHEVAENDMAVFAAHDSTPG